MRANGFRIRGLNADCDKLAVQSSVETTWLLGRGSKTRGPQGKWTEVGQLRDELKVLRPYGGAPAFEIEPLGDKCGCLIGQRARGPTRVMRVGSRYTIELEPDESFVIRCEQIEYPRGAGAGLSV